MSGAIPLVNTSSEEEDDNDLEDSFDRQIAASLEVARPIEIQMQHQFLVSERKGGHPTPKWVIISPCSFFI